MHHDSINVFSEAMELSVKKEYENIKRIKVVYLDSEMYDFKDQYADKNIYAA